MKRFTENNLETMVFMNGNRSKPRFVLQIWESVTLIDFDESDSFDEILPKLDHEKAQGRYAQIYDRDLNAIIV